MSATLTGKDGNNNFILNILEHQPPSSEEGKDGGFYYIPNFISEQEEEYLIEKIKSSPKPKWRNLQARSGHLLCRLQYWGGQISNKQILIPETMPDFLCKFPSLIERIKTTGAFESSKHGQPNHCLVNEYEPGQGIMPHEDGGAYFAAVATVSLGSHSLLDIYRYANKADEVESKVESKEESEAKSREQEPRFCILQERRSLLITKGSAYRDFLHGIAEKGQDDASRLRLVVNKDQLTQPSLKTAVEASKKGETAVLERQLRLSLTFRDVEKVAPKGLTNMFGKR